MKNIKTITFHNAYNYGAMLQTYALQNKIKNLGYETEVIDFLSEELTKEYKVKLFNFSNGIKSFISSLTSYSVRKKRAEIFEKFLKEKIKLTEKRYFTIEDLKKDNESFEICITGSDQVWNPAIVYSPVYFLDFGNEKMKRISYAASFGQEKILKEYEERVGKHLKKFNYISVREKSGINLVKELSGKNAVQVLDPVFLLSKDEWKKLENNIIKDFGLENGYILVYSMEKNPLILETAEKLKKYLNKPIVVIYSSYGITTQIEILKSKNINIPVAGPQEFVTLFVGADCIVTNSFHGTAFSIVFDKPFLSVPHSTRNTRLQSVLELLKLEKRFVSIDNRNLSGKELFNKAKLKDKDTDLLLQNEIKKSEEFLISAIEN